MTDAYPGEQHEAVRRTIVYNIDDQYLRTMGMELAAGRNFSAIAANDSLHVIVNETAVKVFNLGADPIGQVLTAGVGRNGEKRSLTVIGVVKDFHFRSLHEAIAPLVMLNNPYGGLIVRTKTRELAGLISSIEHNWKAYQVEEPFSYALLNELYQDTYVAEQKMGSILKIFGLLTIFVACLGLFGLITFSVDQRVKEVGIRKVLGANVVQIVSMLSRDMVVLMAISFVIAFPLGHYVMNQWLQDFAYRVELNWWVYVVAAVITLLIAFLTMSIKTIRSAVANPVDVLRSE
jgi:putative ABC transport system permease protein